MDTYFAFLSTDTLYHIFHQLTIIDITSLTQEESVLNFFMAYNQKLYLCYIDIKSIIPPIIPIHRDRILSNTGRLECTVITPPEYEQSKRFNLDFWDYEKYYKNTLCVDEYRNILLCNGNEGILFNNNNFWKYMIYSCFNKKKSLRVSYPDFINYKMSYLNFIRLMKIAYIIDKYLIFDTNYNLYLTNKTYHECNLLKKVDGDLFKILILNFMIEGTKGYNYLSNVMLEIIHNVDLVSLQILYHIISAPIFKMYILNFYNTNHGRNSLINLILSYLDITLTSPNASEFYMIPILTFIQNINELFLKEVLYQVLYMVNLDPKKYDTNKVKTLKENYKM